MKPKYTLDGARNIHYPTKIESPLIIIKYNREKRIVGGWRENDGLSSVNWIKSQIIATNAWTEFLNWITNDEIFDALNQWRHYAIIITTQNKTVQRLILKLYKLVFIDIATYIFLYVSLWEIYKCRNRKNIKMKDYAASIFQLGGGVVWWR